MKHKKLFAVFTFALVLALASILFFASAFFSPFQSVKFVVFCAMIELVLPLYFYFLYTYKNLRPQKTELIALSLLAYFGVLLVSTAFGADWFNSLWGRSFRIGGVFLYGHFVALFFYLSLVFKVRKNLVDRFIEWSVLLATIVSVHAILEGLGVIASIDPSYAPRVVGIIGNPTFLGGYLLIPFFLALYLFVTTRSKWKFVLSVAAAVLLFVAILYSGTRGAFLGLFVGISVSSVYYLFMKKGLSLKKLFLPLLLFVVVGGLLFSALHFLSPEDSQLYRLTRFSGATSSDRLIYWKMGVQGWLDYPVLGSGPENYFIAGEKYYEPELYLGEGNWPDKPHNYYVEVLSTTGIIGSAFYLVFIGLLYWSIINTRRKRVISEKVAMLCFGGLTAYLVSLLFLFEMFSFYHPFFLLVAVIASWGAGGKEGKPEGSIKGALGVVCCSAAIPILFLSQFLVPTGFLYYQAGQANHLIEEDVHQAHEIVQKISQLSFVHSYDPLVDTYVTLMQSAFVLGESYAFGEQVSQEAVTVAQLSAERAGNNASLWEKLASVYFLRATILRIEVEEAGFAAAQKSYDIAPKKIGSSILLINMYRNNRQIEEAVSLLEQVLEIAPTDPEVLWAAASVYHALGDQEQAMDYAYRSFMRGVKTYDDNILEWLLNAFYERGEIHKMVDLYEAALVMDPDKVEVLPDLASSYVTIGEYEKAKETALKFLDYYPDEEASVNEFLRALEPYLNDE